MRTRMMELWVRDKVGLGTVDRGLIKLVKMEKMEVDGAVQAHTVLPVPQQHSQGNMVCWERFLHLRSIKVLLVENDDSTRHVVTALLHNCNYEVVEAANGLQAWKILEDLTNHIDLVLTESSGSGSESGTQTQSGKSKSCEKFDKSGSNVREYNGSIGLNVGDGSDSRSGTESLWTKQTVEVVSSQVVSPWDQIAECPDSTCAQVIRPNAEASGNKCVPFTATRECQESGEHLDNVARGNELVIVRPRDQDLQPQLALETAENLRLQKDLPRLWKSGMQIVDSEEFPAIEFSLRSLRKVRDTGKTAQENCNVFRHSELSAFSRYNKATNAFKAPNENTGSGSQLDHSLDSVTKELVYSSQPPYQCSNGVISNNNIDMGSTTNKDFANLVVFKDRSEAMSTANGFHLSSALKPLKIDLVCTSLQTVLLNAEDRATTALLAQPRGSHPELPMQ